VRRSDREIKNFSDIIKVMEKCDVCRLALHDEKYPYIVPLNFGMTVEDEKVTLFFHGALEGKKYDLMKKNDKACFEMDCSHRLVTEMEAGNCTMEYESVIGYGSITEITEAEEKYKALCTLMSHYPVDKEFKFNKAVIPATRIWKLEAEHITGKTRFK
jgi:nitroimidazol reductase NimA-like FMN-containing flavoprotein (pyridoxamine 5'-phosphate oxidase superfamily)